MNIAEPSVSTNYIFKLFWHIRHNNINKSWAIGILWQVGVFTIFLIPVDWKTLDKAWFRSQTLMLRSSVNIKSTPSWTSLSIVLPRKAISSLSHTCGCLYTVLHSHFFLFKIISRVMISTGPDGVSSEFSGRVTRIPPFGFENRHGLMLDHVWIRLRLIKFLRV